MFSLIVVLLSILLVAALLAAALYYGGSAFSHSSDATTVARLVNEGSQIQSAAMLYQTEKGSAATDISILTSQNYLTNAPASWSMTPSGTAIAYTKATSPNVCVKFNAKYGIIGVPSCASLTNTKTPVCCQ
jgi:type II secretory pathway pseudopilin PulG